jgi:branched-chain amino acid aminotransferase
MAFDCSKSLKYFMEDLERALNYGDGFFETLYWHRNHIVLEHYHRRRFEQTAEFLNIDFSKDVWAAVAEGIAAHFKGGNKFGTARVLFYRKGKGKYTPETHQGGYRIMCENHYESPFKMNERGLVIGKGSLWQKPLHPLSNHKTISAVGQVMLSMERNKHNWDEALVLNAMGRVAEGISSNLFIAVKGDLYTPPLTEGPLAGTLRSYILDNAEALKVKVVERSISLNDVLKADEVFFTNAVRGIQWVLGFEKSRYYCQISKNLYEQICFRAGIS